jgi:Domain of unknown function (DUF4394)/FG-GAP-like repeat
MKKISSGRSVFTMLFTLVLVFTASALSASAVTIYGVSSSNQLIRFDSATPGTTTTVGVITGLQTGESIVGMDFRPATGQLYALGSTNRLYIINKNTAVVLASNALSSAITGTEFGVDFNPMADRLRVVSNTGQNLSVNPNNYTVTAQTPLNPGTPNVTAAAYNNNVSGTTATTLYVIDTNSDTLFRQDPPASGTLTSVGLLGINANDVNGFDITPTSNIAYAALTVGAATNLYTINLTSGASTLIGAIGTGTTPLRGLAIDLGLPGSPASVTVDFDGDRRTDLSVFRLSENNWYINRSSNGAFSATNFGSTQTDILTPGDYDGDGKTDVAVWRTTNGFFYYLRSSDGGFVSFQWGQPGDEPIARDYDGDGKTDFAVVRRGNGQATWLINNSTNGSVRIEQFGLSSDTVASGDYDGDGKFDLGVYRGNLGQPATFFIRQSTAGFRTVQWGLGGDLVVPGDYDGDGKTDFAVVRQGQPYTWYILRSSDNQLLANTLGTKPHFTTQGDYDGDGKTDISVFDPEFGFFYVFRSSNGSVTSTKFGQNGDYPIANYDTH